MKDIDEKTQKVNAGFDILEKSLEHYTNRGPLSAEEYTEMIAFVQELRKLISDLLNESTI